MRDLLVITPTRGRPDSARRLQAAIAQTCTAETDLVFAVDEDDPAYADLQADLYATVVRGPRATCPEWSNRIAAEQAKDYRAVASLGDDHVPVTYGWDEKLLMAIDAIGGTGIAYGDDGLQGENLPTAPVVTSDIVQELGWFFLPSCTHFFCDNVWLDLGRTAQCLVYVPEVKISHLHFTSGLSPADATYLEVAGTWDHDEAAYRTWRYYSLEDHAGRISKLMDEKGV